MRTAPSFLSFWAARVLASTYSQMFTVAIGWQMYSLTHSAFSLGFVGLAQFIPTLLLTLVVGHVADRYDRRRIMSLCQLVEALAGVFLLYENLAGTLGSGQLYVIAVVLGVTSAFRGPASSALLPQLVTRAWMPRAIAWSTSGSQAAQIVGPSLGGLLFAAGPTWVYGTTALAAFLAVVLTGFIKVEHPVKVTKGASLASLLEGLVFVRRHPVILGTLSLDLFAVLLGGATALLPIYAQDILRTGPLGLGLMRTAPAVGALIMSVVFAYFPLRKKIGPTLFGALGIFGLSTMLFAVSKSLVLSLAALLLIGASDVVSVVIRTSLVQLQTPHEMQGRVNAVNQLFIGTSNELGEFESGMVAGWIGAVPAALIGGIGTLVVAALWIFLFPSIWRIRSLSEG
ncbi:MFS transporter [Alicyclobacillus cycloheptanicus]|uniref:MFS transporter n=1 Tax=Alicyclobacillus cycloheptanicus TaxID=1457 RepID=UPI003966BE06